jgi:hypothetical protein
MKKILNNLLYATYRSVKKGNDNSLDFFMSKIYFLFLLFIYIAPMVVMAQLYYFGYPQNYFFRNRLELVLFMLPFYFLLTRNTMDYETMIKHNFSEKDIAQGDNLLGILVLLGGLYFIMFAVFYNAVKHDW